MTKWLLAATLALILPMGKADAHEFWIDPPAFLIATDDTLTADLRVGQEFSGATMSYLPRNFVRFDVVQGDAATPVEGRFGDIPALSMDGLVDGLAIIVHQTTANNLTWSEWERFVGFAEHKDLGDVAQMHADRGISQENVREDYIRYAKSLVAVGDGAGADRVVGLRTELVALANPYTDDVSGGMPVQLWLDGALVPDVQVELFDRAPDGEVTITTHRTNAEGVALLPVAAGHVYMADSVTLEAVEPTAESDAVWVTLWANLTFAVP